MKKRTLVIILISFVTCKLNSQVSFTLSNNACSADTKTVSTNTGTDIAISYTWSSIPVAPIFSMPNSATTSINFPSAGSFTINLNVTLVSGSGTYSNAITVAASPTITVTQSSPTTCIMANFPTPNTKAVTIQVSGADPSYTWNPPSPPFMTGNNIAKIVRPTVSTCYTVTGIVGTCSGSAVSCVSVMPQFSVEVAPLSGIRCLNGYLELSIVNIQTTAIVPYTYQWTEDPNELQTINGNPPYATVQVTPLNNTSYTFEVMDSRNCISLPTVVSVTVQNCTGIEPNFLEDISVSFFPNPIKDKMYLDFGQSEIEKMLLTNCLGQSVFILNNPISKQEVDFSFLSSGVYFLAVQNKTQQKVFKVLKD